MRRGKRAQRTTFLSYNGQSARISVKILIVERVFGKHVNNSNEKSMMPFFASLLIHWQWTLWVQSSLELLKLKLCLISIHKVGLS